MIQDMGQVTKGRHIIEKAESIKKELLGPANFSAALSEHSYDGLIILGPLRKVQHSPLRFSVFITIQSCCTCQTQSFRIDVLFRDRESR